MIKLLLKKILDTIYFNKTPEFMFKIICDYFNNRFKKVDLSKDQIEHLQNISVLIGAYTLTSIFIYPEFKFVTFLKEVFSLICVYGAIFLWFIDKIKADIRCKIVIGVTACAAPVIFVSNTFSIALIEILLMIFIEYIVFEYLRGCNLFSNLIPIYLVTDDNKKPNFINKLYKKYKILEIINLSSTNTKNSKFVFNTMNSIDGIKNRLLKTNKIPFFPFPRRILYFSYQQDIEILSRLSELSAEFSIPLFKISDISDNQHPNSLNSDFEISPLRVQDFEQIIIDTQEKAALTSVFKNKRVWIYYDGRQSVFDLIAAICSVNSADLTIFCESETLLCEINNELNGKNTYKNYKTKVIDTNLLNLQESKPDILFYNIPIKSIESSEDNLKEALVKNVLNTKHIIEFAQKLKIRFVFLLSSIEALNASNWIGATQRLGELIVQSADSKSRKLYTKFRIIRLPECITDKTSILGSIISSIKSEGQINLASPNSIKYYHRKDILHPLLKMLAFALKEHDFSSSVYTIMPQKQILLENAIKIICNNLGLRKDEDIKIVCNSKLETMDLESFPNISETLEKTEIDSVMSTKFLSTNLDIAKTVLWDIEQIKEMKTRDLITSVFQNLNEKTKKPN